MGGTYVPPLVHKAVASPDLFAFSPDGRHAVYAAFGDGQIVLFDLQEGKAVRSFKSFAGVHDIRFSSLTGKLTITSLDRSDVQALDVRTGEVHSLVNIADPDQRGIDHMSQTLSGRTGIAIRPGDPFAHLIAINKDGASLLRSIELSGPPLRAYVSSDNRHVLLPSTQAPVVDIVDLNTLNSVAVIKTPGLITNVHTDPLSRNMVGIAPDAGAVIAFDMATLTAQVSFEDEDSANLLALNEESGLAFVHSGGRSQNIQLVQVRGRNTLERFENVKIDQPLWAMTSTNALAVCH
ncbi:MAG: WD40 repeat domain-containing protein [Pseudomonadota bacterium]